MLQAIRDGEPCAIVVSPEIYHDQLEFLQQVNSAYTSSEPEVGRFPWLGIEGIPVIVDPNMEEDAFALMSSRDFIDDMRIALDIHTDGMLHSFYKVSYGGLVGD
jgi:hypothetical protein